jgi:hypothetical protein
VEPGMQIPIKDQLELVGKVVAVVGPAFAALKAIVIYAVDHSMDRKSSKTVEEIDAYLTRLTKLESREFRQLVALRHIYRSLRPSTRTIMFQL